MSRDELLESTAGYYALINASLILAFESMSIISREDFYLYDVSDASNHSNICFIGKCECNWKTRYCPSKGWRNLMATGDSRMFKDDGVKDHLISLLTDDEKQWALRFFRDELVPPHNDDNDVFDDNGAAPFDDDAANDNDWSDDLNRNDDDDDDLNKIPKIMSNNLNNVYHRMENNVPILQRSQVMRRQRKKRISTPADQRLLHKQHLLVNSRRLNSTSRLESINLNAMISASHCKGKRNQKYKSGCC
eukprot:108433_1